MRRSRIDYLPEELAWIEARKEWPRARLHSAFCFMFDRVDVTVGHLSALCKRKGWTTGPDGRRRNKGKSRVFSHEQVRWMHDNGTLSRAELEHAFSMAFPGTTITAGQLVAFRKRHSIRTGRTGHFVKGQPSHNKGRKGFCAPGSEKGHFKAGQEPPNQVPLWSERMSKDGYIEIKVPERNPWTGNATRFRHKHRYLWEQVNGPVPDGCALKCLDGNKTNTDPSNWEAVPRGVLARLNGGRFKKRLSYDAAAPELKPTVMAIAKVEHAAQQLKESLN